MKEFRSLTADDVECRVATVSQKGCSLLLYKNARCDMAILDQTVGPLNWQRSHSRDNANCTVSIWDEDKNQWISKEDTGTESYTEKEKGLASDSFKRACFNWGIGRELYTAPFIWVNSQNCTISSNAGGKATTYDKFEVTALSVENHRITGLQIKNSKTGRIVYTYGNVKTAQNVLQSAAAAGVPVRKECTCTKCGNVVKDVVLNGVRYNAEEIYSKTGGLCWSCAAASKKKKEEEKV